MKPRLLACLFVSCGIAAFAHAQNATAVNAVAPSGTTTPQSAPASTPANAVASTESFDTLAEGDPAPPFAPGAWVKGPIVQQLEKGKIYVIEFWATWCGPCKISIPLLSDLQKKYPDVTFIGQDIWEPDPAKVVPYVLQMGHQMNYRVVMDDVSETSEGRMATTWMHAAGLNTIPTAFLVDKNGLIAWIGRPFELETQLQLLLSGALDTQQIAADRIAMSEGEAKTNALIKNGQWAAAIQFTRDFDQAHPGLINVPATLGGTFLYAEVHDPAAAQKISPAIYDALKDDADILNDVSWQLAVNPQIAVHDFPLALKFAARAVELTTGQDASALDTVAHIYFAQGDTANAVLYETQAMDKAPTPDTKQQISETLKQFQLAAQAPRQNPVK